MIRIFVLSLISIFIFVSGCSEQVKQTETDTHTSQHVATEEVESELTVHYINVGQADATLFQYTDSVDDYTILYDTGDWKSDDVIQYLKDQSIDNIDLIVISHPDADHMGQLSEIVQNYDVEEVWMSGNESSSDVFQRGIETVLTSDAAYDEPRAGEEFSIGPMDIAVLHPSEITGETNEESLSLLFSYKDIELLFTGDADKDAEKQMLQTNSNIQADILHLGHHGSNTSSNATFIHEVNPKVAIFSAAADSPYGHPHEEVVSLIEEKGIELYGTASHGTIILKTDGRTYEIHTKDEHEQKQPTASDETERGNNACIDINTASLDELDTIIHIGPDRAKELVDKRPFEKLEQLTVIQGIGSSHLNDIKKEKIACIGG